MSEQKLISPLLDGFALGNPISEHDGVRCCPAIKENSDKKYIVKIIAVPASQVQLDAMLLAGAYRDAEDAMKYFKTVAEDVMAEAAFLKELGRLEGFLPYEGWQLEPITRRRLGYEVYLVSSYKRSLEKHVRKHPFTHLEAVNLGLDLCAALQVCREAGALYVDLKPANIFVSEKKEYRIGDLGFIKLDALKYTALPVKYRSRYTPPELNDPMASVNLSTDTFAVGMILYQLYNEGHLPFKDTMPEEGLPAPVNADYELSEIIMKAIDPDPEKRWQDPKEMGQALVAYMQRNVVNDVPITPYIPLDTQAQNVQIPQPPKEETLKAAPVVQEAAEEVPSEEQAAEEATEEASGEAAPEEPAQQLPEDAGEEAAPEEEIPEEPAAEAPAGESEPNEITQEEPETVSQEIIPEKPPVYEAPPVTAEEISEELSRIFAKADDLISHETPVGVVLPEIPEPLDPFAFATEDSIELEDLRTPFDPVMDIPEEKPKKEKNRKKFLSPERKKKVKRFFTTLLTLIILALIGCGAYWYYQNMYLQTIHQLQIDGDREKLTVSIDTNADESLLTVTCSDTYGNTQSDTVSGGQVTFTGLLPNTMYRIEVSIDGFHDLVGQTSDVFTTDTTTSVETFTAVTGPEDGSVVLSFSVDGDEPEEWIIHYTGEGEETREEKFSGHTITIDDLSIGKIYTFVLSAGDDLSLSGKTALDVMASRLILAENLTATTTNGTDMTIHWTSPGDTVVESWLVRCYNDVGYEQEMTVSETEVYLTGIDSSVSYNVEVTAAGMTQPARTSITANPINITALNVDTGKHDQMTVSWEFTGAEPEGGWLLMYKIDGNSNLNVSKCDKPSATIEPKIPGAVYQFTIQSVDGTSIFDNVHSFTCPAGEPFDQNGLAEKDITVNLVKRPEESDWSFDKIGVDAFTTEFKVGDPISIVLHGSTNFYLPGMELDLLYVIRDAHGNVLPDYVSEAQGYWKEIWLKGNYHYGELDIPAVPEKAGTYSLHLYFNGFSIGTAEFTISE